MKNSIVSIKHLYKEIKGTKILNDINLEIPKGAICGIIGRNASGKSMLFKCITNLVNITSGDIEVDGIHSPFKSAPLDIGALIEYPGFLPNFNGYRNLEMLAYIKNIAKPEDIKGIMTRLGLNPNDKKHYKHYSLGMRQKLGIACAIMEKAPIILLDEPTNNVDFESVQTIQEIILELNREYNITFLITSHHLEEIKNMCSVIYEIKAGEIYPFLGEQEC